MLQSSRRGEVGFTLAEAVIAISILALVAGIVLSAFVGIKKSLEAQARAQARLDAAWRFATLADALEGACSNEGVGMARLYVKTDGVWIPAVDPYTAPIPSLKGVADGFYAGECGSSNLAIARVKEGTMITITGGCTPTRWYHLGHSGLSAYVRIYQGRNGVFLEEGVETERYGFRLGGGSFKVILLRSGGGATSDPKQADYFAVEYTDEEGKKWTASASRE